MDHIVDISLAKKTFTFYHNKDKKETYFCKCGGTFVVDSLEGSEFSTEDEELSKVFGIASVSLRESLKCPHCDTNYKILKNQDRLVSMDTYFMSGYKYENNNDICSLSFGRIKAVNDNGVLSFYELTKEIFLTKEDNKIFFKDEDDSLTEMDLNNIVSIVEMFFSEDAKITSNMHELHMFCLGISSIVPDSVGVEDFFDETKTSLLFNIEIFKKMFIVFFSTIKYGNLSTITLTKGMDFLHELLRECNPPTSDDMKKANVTSPIKIFNYLANNYIENINQEINQDKVNYQEMVFKLDDKEMNIKVKNTDGYKEGKVLKSSTGEYEVFHLDTDGKISKFIYNKIKNFNDYKQLIRYTKHLEYNELVDILSKYDYDLIINMIDLVYYRNGMTLNELKRLIPLFVDYCTIKTKEIKKRIDSDDEVEFGKIDYKFVKTFDFGFYDDCLMMLKTLDFDPKKDFYKIKTNKELKDFHDEVVKYYNAIKQEEDTGYQAFFDKFRFLETKGENDYDGPLEVEILDTPTKVVQEGRDMHHSAASYVDRVMDGKYILLKVTDHSIGLPKEELTRFTMGIFYNQNNGFEFEQIKSYGNKLGSNRFKTLIIEWLEKKEVIFDENKRVDIKLKINN